MNFQPSIISRALTCANLVKNLFGQQVRTAVKNSTKMFPVERRRHGYEIRLHKGLLPRDPEESRPLPIPDYRPRDVWAPKRALFGQNDYIDILGNESIHPVSLHYHVPFYARGMQGNEYRMLLHKKKMLQQTKYPVQQPKRWRELQKRINYLYRFMNRKTPTPTAPTNQF